MIPSVREALTAPTEERRWTDELGHGKNLSERGALNDWREHMNRQIKTRKESEQASSTHSLKSAGGRISRDIKSERTSSIHFLESADGRRSQDTERIQASEGHLQRAEERNRT